MKLESILKHQINKEQIYKNIVKNTPKNDIIKLGIPLIILGIVICVIKKGNVQNDRKTSA